MLVFLFSKNQPKIGAFFKKIITKLFQSELIDDINVSGYIDVHP